MCVCVYIYNDTKYFLTKDMQTPSLKNGQIFMKDAEYAETKEVGILFQIFIFSRKFIENWL